MIYSKYIFQLSVFQILHNIDVGDIKLIPVLSFL